jgi:DNA polymerase elongation subunit (family B)
MSNNLDPILNIQKGNREYNFGREPKVLTIDIETAPNIVKAWGLWQQNIAVSQIVEPGRVICFAAKWHDKKKVEFYSENNVGHEEMVKQAWRLLDEADIVVGYNSPGFDIKHLNAEFIKAGMTPPSPFKNVDLLRTARSQFKFPSNKLDYVGQILGLGKKVVHTGQHLWNEVEAGNLKAWKTMEKYNIQDVRLTEAVFDYLGPWIKGLPHRSLWTGKYGCYACGSENLTQSGWYQTTTNIYVKLQCEDCGAWNRGNTGKNRTDTKAI